MSNCAVCSIMNMVEWSFKSFVCVSFYVSEEYFNILGNTLISFEI